MTPIRSKSGSKIASTATTSELKDSCTSPSGVAIFGIHVLDKAYVAFGIAAAVEAHKRDKLMAEHRVD